MARDDPDAARGDVRERVEAARCGLGPDDEVSATIALQSAVHHFGRLDGAGTVDWCRRALELAGPDGAVGRTARTYLAHGLGYLGRVADALRGRRGRRRRGGRRGRPRGGLAAAPLGAGGPAAGRGRPGRCAGGSRRRREPGLRAGHPRTSRRSRWATWHGPSTSPGPGTTPWATPNAPWPSTTRRTGASPGRRWSASPCWCPPRGGSGRRPRRRWTGPRGGTRGATSGRWWPSR